MDFALTDEQVMIRDAARKFAETELAPQAAALEEPRNRPLLLANLKRLAELGFMGLDVSAAYGGSEAGAVAFSLAITELARGCASTAVTVSVTNMVAEVIQACGSEAQRRRFLPPLMSGEWPAGAFCLTEAEAGSDPAAMRLRAERQGDHYVLNGRKIYITSAPYAGVFVVWGVTDPQAPKGKGISCFLVEAGTPGLVIGKEEEKMGQKGSATTEVLFENCRVPAENLLGKENEGYRIAVGELAGGRIGIASLALGVGLAALDYARDYMLERTQFGCRLADFQGLQWMMVDSYTELEAARLLTLQAAWRKERREPYAREASMAKLFATERAVRACYVAQQMLGGAGYLKDHPVERFARDVRVTTIYEGTSEIQRLIVARHLFGR
ncbi:MAG: acyl-CoA dehydrogenase [Porticoccaceae bacterium]|nr:MAG: acyl-CoA dehydrogenase [Porticoccaceae bacterium]